MEAPLPTRMGQLPHPPTRFSRGVARPLVPGLDERHDGAMGSAEPVGRGREALRSGRWEGARAAFTEALRDEESPEALAGLGTALWWLGQPKESARVRERAFVLLRDAADDEGACLVAIDLVITYLVNLGNPAAARGWLRRAERLGSRIDAGPVHGWIWLMRAYLTDDPSRSQELLEQAFERAQETGDRDLELVALGDLGLHQVRAGRVDEGLAMLDEAMAGSMAGEGRRLETIVYTSCGMLEACQLAGDLDRATQWCRVVDEFMREFPCPFLFAQCRVRYGTLLLSRGRWDHAETELRAAVQLAADAGPGARSEALTRLAVLRVRQGRLEEADELLAGCEDEAGAVLATAELRLAQGDPTAAVALLERLPDPERHGMPSALAILTEAHLACGDLASAAGTADRLAALAGDDEEGRALAALASAHVLQARGRLAEAVARLEQAVGAFSRTGLAFETGRTRLELARAIADRQPAAAAADARSALRLFERIGATAYADRAAALLRSLGERVRRDGQRAAGALTQREREVLDLVASGLSNPEIAARLFISRKTASHHVSNLLMKVGARNRAELAAYAIRAGSSPAEPTP